MKNDKILRAYREIYRPTQIPMEERLNVTSREEIISTVDRLLVFSHFHVRNLPRSSVLPVLKSQSADDHLDPSLNYDSFPKDRPLIIAIDGKIAGGGDNITFVCIRPAHWTEAEHEVDRLFDIGLDVVTGDFESIFAVHVLVATNEGTSSEGVALCARLDSGKLVFMPGGFLMDGPDRQFEYAKAVLMVSRTMTLGGVYSRLKQERWIARVTIGTDCIPIDLLTDPAGVKDVWKLRDIPEGARRRDALLHWVSDHWRQNRIDPDIEGYVRKHMRGQNECTQGGMKIEIIPSQVDMAEVESAKVERIDMRKSLKDRRKRLLQLSRN